MAILGVDIVTDALYQNGALGQGDNLSDADAQLCLRRLNRMLDSWSNESQMVFALTEETFVMTPALGQYSTSLLALGRPIEIMSIFVRLSNIDWDIEFIDYQTWGAIAYKPVTSVPQYCYVDTDYPDMTMNFYPTPYAGFTCFVTSKRALVAAPITLSTNVTLPPGYEKAIVDCLAVDCAPSFGRLVTPEMMQAGTSARAWIKRTNYIPLTMETGLEARHDPSNGFIYQGWR